PSLRRWSEKHPAAWLQAFSAEDLERIARCCAAKGVTVAGADDLPTARRRQLGRQYPARSLAAAGLGPSGRPLSADRQNRRPPLRPGRPLPPGQRRTHRTPELSGRHLGARPATIIRTDGQLYV